MNESQQVPGRGGPGHAFLLDPAIAHLNHGSFGACPRPVLESLQGWQAVIERHPSAVVSQEHGYDRLVDDVRARLATYVGASADRLVLVPNTTTGLNAVACSLDLRPGDEVLTTDHEYDSMVLLWEQACARAAAHFVRQRLPFPVSDPDALVEAVWSGVTDRTRVLYLSHVTCKTSVRMPIEELCRRARERDILTVVDGAHGPGHLPLRLDELAVDVYAASCHKWLCGPRGTGFLYVRPEHQTWVRPAMVSHGSEASSRFVERFRWQGTRDPSPFLALPAALDLVASPDWQRGRERCHQLARAARAEIGNLFGLPPLTPDSTRWFGQMVSVPIPDCDDRDMRRRLFDEHGVDAPVRTVAGASYIRASFQIYNTEADLYRLVEALQALLGKRAVRR